MSIGRPLLAVVLALGVTCASVAYQRVGPTRLVEGEGFGCGVAPCRIPVVGGGFPLPYLVDNPQVSVPDRLGLFEDDFRGGAFVLDFALYLMLVVAAARVVGRPDV